MYLTRNINREDRQKKIKPERTDEEIKEDGDKLRFVWKKLIGIWWYRCIIKRTNTRIYHSNK